MNSAPPRPITPRQALLLLVSRQVMQTGHVDPLMAHYCLNLLVFEASRRFPNVMAQLVVPRPRKSSEDTISLREWEDVFDEKIEEALLSDQPYEYAFTPEGNAVAKRLEEGKVNDPAWFEPAVTMMFSGTAHRFFVDKARELAGWQRRDLREFALMVA